MWDASNWKWMSTGFAGLIGAAVLSFPGAPQAQSVDVTPALQIVDTKTSLRLEVPGSPAMILTDAVRVSERINGGERSECDRSYGRRSLSFGDVSISPVDEPNRIRLTMKTHLSANGGHFRTCATCFQGRCVGIFGNDTRAKSTADTTATIRMTLPQTIRVVPWYIETDLSVSDTDLSVRLTQDNGADVPSVEGKTNRFLVTGEPGSEFYVNIAWRKEISNEGGCCSDDFNGTIALTVRAEPGPILYSAKVVSFIRGGHPTESHKAVGAIRLDGLTHCTGTLIGPRTIITAAHCVAGYHDQIKEGRMTFGTGISAIEPDSEFTVTSGEYPNLPGSGFLFNRSTLEDDVGLLFVSDPIPSINPARLHSGSPSWEEFKGTPLTFVGYGYNVIGGDLMGIGVKREASWKIDDVFNRTIRWKSRLNVSTCSADSGGPAIAVLSNEALLVAITSSGDTKCTEGTNMRVDSYLPWIEARVR